MAATRSTARPSPPSRPRWASLSHKLSQLLIRSRMLLLRHLWRRPTSNPLIPAPHAGSAWMATSPVTFLSLPHPQYSHCAPTTSHPALRRVVAFPVPAGGTDTPPLPRAPARTHRIQVTSGLRLPGLQRRRAHRVPGRRGAEPRADGVQTTFNFPFPPLSPPPTLPRRTLSKSGAIMPCRMGCATLPHDLR